ncbi:MAG: DUF3494 domain-containing protein [Planctomycetes bacterium]|nr:DUF3494 domain-containing protein [Planctomycetota bacterium]
MTRIEHKSSKWHPHRRILAAIGGAILVGISVPAGAAGGPPLGAARTYAALGGSTVTSTGLSSLTGDVGVWPGSAIIGFPPATVTGALHAGDAAAALAHADAALAYNFLAGMYSPPANDRTGVDLGGKTLAPGVYHFNTSAQLTGALVLDAQGDSNALFVIKVGSTLITSSGASVVVINGGADYDESNVFWQVGTSATLGSGTSFTGNILASQSITCVIGSSMTGNALALNGAVTMDSNANTSPTIIVPGVPPVVPPVLRPTNLTAVLNGPVATPGAGLRWTDSNIDEVGFYVFRRAGAGAFAQIATVPSPNTAGTGGLMTYQDDGLSLSTTYSYQVTGYTAASVETPPSNQALVDTAEPVVVPPVDPPIIPVIALTGSLSGDVAAPGTLLSWFDVSADETSFRIYRRDGDGPAFVLVGTTPSTTTLGTGAAFAFQDLVLNPSTTYTYRVTSVPASGTESGPSNEVLVDTGENPTPPARWLDVNLGRRRSAVRDRMKAHRDRVYVRGSYAVIDVDSSVPSVVRNTDPRVGGMSIQVRAPGNLVFLNIPPNDAGWVSTRKGIYRWRTHNGRNAPLSRLWIDTRKSEFALRSFQNDFSAVPRNEITVSLTMLGAAGYDDRVWNFPSKLPVDHSALYRIPR